MGRRSAAEELRSSHACFTRALAPKLHSTDLHQYPEQLEVLWLSQWWERRLVGHTQRPRTDSGHRATLSGPYLRTCVGFGLSPDALMGKFFVLGRVVRTQSSLSRSDMDCSRWPGSGPSTEGLMTVQWPAHAGAAALFMYGSTFRTCKSF